MEAFAEAFDIRRLHLASDPVRPWYLMNSLVCGGQPILDPSAYASNNLNDRVSSGKLCARVANIWLTGHHSACSALPKQNGGLEFALAKDGRDCDFQLKPEQKKIIDAVVCRKKDVLGILPTGFGKSLIFHLLSNVFDFMEAGQPPAKGRSTTIVISPLNALMRDQISKLGQEDK